VKDDRIHPSFTNGAAIDGAAITYALFAVAVVAKVTTSQCDFIVWEGVAFGSFGGRLRMASSRL
jgi:hypothetical protein